MRKTSVNTAGMPMTSHRASEPIWGLISVTTYVSAVTGSPIRAAGHHQYHGPYLTRGEANSYSEGLTSLTDPVDPAAEETFE